MKKLIVTVGLPRSGKSTWAKKQNLPIVSRDAIRLALHGERFIPVAEDMVRILAHYMTKSLFLAGCTTVILDECNITQKLRDKWTTSEWETEFKIFYTSENICIKRAELENDTIIIPIIKNMAKTADFFKKDKK